MALSDLESLLGVLDNHGLWLIAGLAAAMIILLTCIYVFALNRHLRDALKKEHEINTKLLQTEEALRFSEARLVAILDAVHAGFVLVDAKTKKILDLNETACDILGCPKSELVGQICHSCYCPACEGECPVLDKGQTIRNEKRVIRRPDGREIQVVKTVVQLQLGKKDCLMESFVALPGETAEAKPA